MRLLDFDHSTTWRRQGLVRVPSTYRPSRAFALLVCVTTIALLASCGRGDEKASDVQPQEQAGAPATAESARFVIGNLGGSQVRIPSYYVEGYDYDGDPSFGVARDGPSPVRTQESRLRTISLRVRYPDMAGQSTPELQQNRRSYQSGNTPWMSVLIKSGEDYYPNSLNNLYASRDTRRIYKFTAATEPVFGLRRYSPVGLDPELRKAPSYSAHPHDQDIFVDFASNDRVATHIVCSNLTHESAPCVHEFDLAPEMRATASVLYRRDLLSDWAQIQRLTEGLIRSFRIN